MTDEESYNETSSNEISSESDEDVILDIPDKDFFKTLSYLKNRDPRIYDNNVQFFTEPPIVIKNKNKEDSTLNQSSDEVPGSSNENDTNGTVTKSQPNNKFSLKDFDDGSSSEDELVSLKKQSSDAPLTDNDVENEYIQFLKGRKVDLHDKQFENELKPLQNFWNIESLDKNEQFLKDYILNKKYLATDSKTTIENENLSEDERELEEQAEYEANYNFKFENGENLQIKRFPRNIEGSMRRKNDARSKKRAELAQRKKEEKAKKYQEVKKKQKEKLSEIEERLKKLKELTGNAELGFKDEEILEDFDPEKHDQKMRELYNEDYYSKEDYEHPIFNKDDYWEGDDIEMDCEDNVQQKKLTRTQKKKLRKKKSYKDIMDIAKPSFDPKVHSDFKKYIDEYYSLDCEDFIDDIPCKYKYREVVPNDYGLSVEEILMADDNELQRWSSVQKCWKRRPEHVERNEVSIYRKKAQDEALKQTILKSLYTPPDQEEVSTISSDKADSVKKIMHTDIHENMEFKEEEQESKTESFHSDKTPLLESNHKDEALSYIPKKKKKIRKHKNVDNDEDYSSPQQTFEKSHDDENENSTIEESDQLSIKNSTTNFMKESEHDRNTNKVIDNVNDHSRNGKNEESNSTAKSKKKRIRKKKKVKAEQTSTDTNSTSQTNDNSRLKNNSVNIVTKNNGLKINTAKHSFGGEPGKVKNKFKNKFGFKKKKKSVVDLSDSRLQAYGIKPKQFRSKMLYSQKNKAKPMI